VRLTTKLWLGFASILALQVASGAWLYYAGVNNAQGMNDLTEVVVPALASATEVRLQVTALRGTLTTACAEEDEDALAESVELSTKSDQILREMVALTQDDSIEALRTRLLAYFEEGVTLCRSLIEGEELENFGERFGAFAAESYALPDVAETHRLKAEKAIQDTSQAMLATVETNRNVLAISLVVLLLLVLAIGSYLSRILRYQLVERIAQISSAIASGDLAQDLSTNRQDESGEIERSLSEMSSSLAQMIGEVQRAATVMHQSVGHLTPAADEMKATASGLGEDARKMHEATEETSAAVSTVESSVGEINSVVEAVTKAAEDARARMDQAASDMDSLSEATSETRSAGEEMSAHLPRMAESSKKSRTVAAVATERTAHASQLMSELGQTVTEIESMVEVVNEIAQRTNLLALNASIEAANAGDVGRGFGVVANEVKELAQETRLATERISEMVDSVGEHCRRSSEAIGGIDEIMGTVREASDEIVEAVSREQTIANKIATASDAASSAARQVSGAVSSTDQAMHGLSRHAANLESAMSKISCASIMTQDSTQTLRGLVETVHEAARGGTIRADLTLENARAVAAEVERIRSALMKFRVRDEA
jgi:methyl-accepting chemotaxis protein